VLHGSHDPPEPTTQLLIREMSVANPLWGVPQIHSEPLKLGIDVGQTMVAEYMAKRRTPPLQGWKTFLRNHADGIASMDLFLVPTTSFRPLCGFPTGTSSRGLPLGNPALAALSR
jgi:hypothetical protein